MKYTMDDLKKIISELPDLLQKAYLSKSEKEELVRYGIIVGATGAITVITAIAIMKKLKRHKKVQVIEIQSEDYDGEKNIRRNEK
ncbi:MAG: hypothetical protein Q8873_05385 [Bacillota bacterium]|nr:hypothetical protein [Bacillota bacterium]